MRKAIVIMALMLVLALTLGGSALAGSGDENFHGEDDEQPGVGVDVGPGETQAPGSPGDRTRNFL